MLTRWSVAAGLCGVLAPLSFAQFQDFATWTGFDVGTTAQIRFPSAFELADVDGDGRDDLVVVSNESLPRLCVKLALGDGTYGPGAFHVLVKGAVDLAVADLDGDGDRDIAVAEGNGTMGNGNTVAVFKNSGAGVFALSQRATAGAGPAGIAAADFDLDGDVDLAIANYGVVGSGTQVRLMTNSGTGSFVTGPTRAVVAAPWALEVGDLNADGRPDVVVAHEDSDAVSILLGQVGGLAAPQAFDVNASTAGGSDLFPCVALFDVDHDGDLDVAFSDNNHQKFIPLLRGVVSTVRNLGGGSFALGNDIVLRPGATGFTDIALADVNHDGWQDLLGVDRQDWDFVLSDGVGGYVVPTAINYGFQATDEPIAIGAQDLDADGTPDALVLGSHSNAISIHRFVGGAPQQPQIVSPGPQSKLDAADLDGDGDLDVVGGGTSIGVLLNQGGGTFAPVVNYPSVAFNGPAGVKLRDLDSDGRPDLLLGTLAGFNTRLNLGNGSFGANTQWNVPHCGINDIDAADFDQDGALDVVFAEFAGCPSVPQPRVFLVRGKGDGTFFPPTTFVPSGFTQTLDHADLNGDGMLDLVLAQNAWLEVYLGNGDLTFQPKIVVPADFAPYGIAIADFDADGIPDLASCNYGNLDDDGIEESMTVMLGHGDGTFEPRQLHAANGSWDLGSTRAIGAADVDRDGDVDLCVVNSDSGDVSLYRNRGDGTFLEHVRIGGSLEPNDLVLGDFTGDGIVDLALSGSPGLAAQPALMLAPGLGNDPWIAVEPGVPGTFGVPRMNGDGAIVGGNTLTLRVAKARQNAFGMLFVGFSSANAPLLSGTLYPTPTLALPIATDAEGEFALTAPLPALVAGGFTLIAQTWIADPVSPTGIAAATNAVFATAP